MARYLSVLRQQRAVESREFVFPVANIQFVHPGMEYHDDDGAAGHAMCVNDMGNIRAGIEPLIAE